MNSIHNLIKLKDRLKLNLEYAKKHFPEHKSYLEHLIFINELASTIKTGVYQNEL